VLFARARFGREAGGHRFLNRQRVRAVLLAQLRDHSGFFIGQGAVFGRSKFLGDGFQTIQGVVIDVHILGVVPSTAL